MFEKGYKSAARSTGAPTQASLEEIERLLDEMVEASPRRGTTGFNKWDMEVATAKTTILARFRAALSANDERDAEMFEKGYKSAALPQEKPTPSPTLEDFHSNLLALADGDLRR